MAAKGKGAKAGMKITKAMPGKRSAARRGAKLGTRAAKRNAYVQAILHNERVHERVRSGLESSRAAYRRVSRRGKGAEGLAKDRKARRHLGQALVSFQEAAAVVRGEKVTRRRRVGVRAVVPMVLVGGAGAVILNEGFRQKVVGLVSGSANGSEPSGQTAQEGLSTSAGGS